MNQDRWERYAAWSGLVFIALLIVGLSITPDPPKLDASAQEIAQYYTDEQDGIQASAMVIVGSLFFFVWFLGSLRAALAAAEGGARRLANLVFGSGLLITASIMAAVLFTAGAAFHPDDTPAEVTRTLNDLAVLSFVPATAIFVAFFLASAVVIFRTGALPRWVGWLGLVTAAASVLGIGAMLTDERPFAADGALGGLLPLVLFMVWFGCASLTLARHRANA